MVTDLCYRLLSRQVVISYSYDLRLSASVPGIVIVIVAHSLNCGGHSCIIVYQILSLSVRISISVSEVELKVEAMPFLLPSSRRWTMSPTSRSSRRRYCNATLQMDAEAEIRSSLRRPGALSDEGSEAGPLASHLSSSASSRVKRSSRSRSSAST